MTASIYVGTYKKYNHGDLFGNWLDLENFSDTKEFYAACKKLHADEHDPELMFQDWEGIPDNLISECHLDEDFFDYMEAVKTSHLDLEVFLAGAALSIPYDKIEEAYHGEWSSDKDFVMNWVDDMWDIGDLPSYIHINWEGTTRDIMQNYNYCESEGHYFDTCY